jgi:hypothetical protein
MRKMNDPLGFYDGFLWRDVYFGGLVRKEAARALTR